ncbi:MAG: FAD-dependent oxidoreductase [Polymorphobacter sp.]
MTTAWDKQVDVLVIGSGAGGLLAGLVAAHNRADVLIVEKGSEWGGTSATSGGGIWIPCSDQAKALGRQDSADEAFTYVRKLSSANVPDSHIRAFIDNAPEMLRWVTANTIINYESLPYPDYHVEEDGGKDGFRTHMPTPIDGRLLGDDMATLRAASPAASLFGYINWQFTETYALLFRPPGWTKALGKILLRYYGDIGQRLKSSKDRYLTLGNALAGGLRLALKDRGVQLWLDSPMTDLVTENGRVTGAVVRRNGKLMRIGARRGVVLAAGGFEQSARLRAQYVPSQPNPVRSGGNTNNTGDSIVAALKVGAATRNMHSTWSAPVFSVPGEDRGRLSTIERALPGCIMVNQAGKRYLNEAASYHIVGQKMVALDAPGAGTMPSWVIFDHRFRHKYPMGPLLPLLPDWAQSRAVQQILKKAPTLEELARKIGVDPAALTATVARFNAGAATGEDPDFQRGAAIYDRMYGDASNQPNPCLAPITQGPFYAFPIHAGDIGTNGGLVTDDCARVLDDSGQPIAGLYAAGNNAATMMGESYPGAGATLGPSLTFGYVAGRHMTGANA